MFGKIFEQIYDSSIAEDWTVRTVFQDMIILADKNGVVDRTPEALSRRTNVPLEVVKRAIAQLEAPDPMSRTPDHKGVRITRIDDHRDWGWIIVNYEKFRLTASEEQRREKTKNRVRKFREINVSQENVTQCNASGSDRNDFPYPSPSACTVEGVQGEMKKLHNHPPIEQALKYFKASDYSEAEVRAAFLYFEAGNLNGDWMWGKRALGDWRAGMETRMAEERMKNQPKHPWNGKPVDTKTLAQKEHEARMKNIERL